MLPSAPVLHEIHSSTSSLLGQPHFLSSDSDQFLPNMPMQQNLTGPEGRCILGELAEIALA
jgi:hypothetical protein